MKPYQTVPICECDEPLVPIPDDRFFAIDPHPYRSLGAPYGQRSPFFVRQGVLERLGRARAALQAERPGWTFQIFDALRPVAVQKFMVEHSLAELARTRGLDPDDLSETDRAALLAEVQVFWAIPSLDPATPPPHSTGGAIDLTLATPDGQPLDLGSPIDELSPRSYPDHFASAEGENAAVFHERRQLLRRALTAAGFAQHPNEWWHFSYGDQMWALATGTARACYGRAPETPIEATPPSVSRSR